MKTAWADLKAVPCQFFDHAKAEDWTLRTCNRIRPEYRSRSANAVWGSSFDIDIGVRRRG